MSDVKISDIGHALITLDLTLDQLCAEEAELEQKLEHVKARQMLVQRAIDSILQNGKYTLGSA